METVRKRVRARARCESNGKCASFGRVLNGPKQRELARSSVRASSARPSAQQARRPDGETRVRCTVRASRRIHEFPAICVLGRQRAVVHRQGIGVENTPVEDCAPPRHRRRKSGGCELRSERLALLLPVRVRADNIGGDDTVKKDRRSPAVAPSPMTSGSLPVASSYCWCRCVRVTGEGDAEKGYAYQHAGSGKFFITLRQVIEFTVWCCGIVLFAQVNIRCNVL